MPFVLLASTLGGPDPDRRRARELGAAGFLVRPVKPQVLLREVQARLG